MRQAIAIGGVVVVVAAFISSAAWAGGVQRLGDHPTQDQLIDALAVPPDPNGSGRGLLPFASRPTGRPVSNDAPAPERESDHPTAALDIKFEFNSAQLTGQAKEVIRTLGEAINSARLKADHFIISGHTDSTGRPDYNMRLSNRRAQTVRDYLVERFAVDPGRLEVVGRGQEEPLDPDNPESGVNRRVQIVNLGP